MTTIRKTYDELQAIIMDDKVILKAYTQLLGIRLVFVMYTIFLQIELY